MFACRYGQTKTASLLLKEGLNVQAETEKQQWTSLHRACANGHHATAEVLLNSCPELLHHADDKGMTPLMAACQSGQSKIASALIRRGAAVDLKNGSGETALWIAAKGGMSDAIKVLTHSKEGRESKLVNQKLRHNGQMMTPVMIAVSGARGSRGHAGHVQLAQLLPCAPPQQRYLVSPLSPLRRCARFSSFHPLLLPLRLTMATTSPCEPSSRSRRT